ARVPEVEADALLADVDPDEVGGLVGAPLLDLDVALARLVALARPLDLEHAGAEVGHQPRAVGTGEDAGEVEDDQAVEQARGVGHAVQDTRFSRAREAAGARRAPAACASSALERYGVTTSAVALTAVPSAVVMLIVPVTARGGIVNCTSVVDDETTATSTVPTLTIGSALPVLRLVPRTITTPSSSPTAGVKLVTFGSTLKVTALGAVPMALVMLTGPVRAPGGTTARSDVAVTAV